jgi:hypothetical protein
MFFGVGLHRKTGTRQNQTDQYWGGQRKSMGAGRLAKDTKLDLLFRTGVLTTEQKNLN